MGVKVSSGHVRIGLQMEEGVVTHVLRREFVDVAARVRKQLAEGNPDEAFANDLWREIIVNVEGYDVEEGDDWVKAVALSYPAHIIGVVTQYLEMARRATELPIPFGKSKPTSTRKSKGKRGAKKR